MSNRPSRLASGRGGQPTILYYRTRPSEPLANASAMHAQQQTRDRLIAGGAYIFGLFTEDESAAAGCPEPRPVLAQAYAVALSLGHEDRPCTLAVLQVDAIGAGAPFPVHNAAVRFLDDPEAPVSTRYLGSAAMDRQLKHEWQAAGCPGPIAEPRIRLGSAHHQQGKLHD